MVWFADSCHVEVGVLIDNVGVLGSGESLQAKSYIHHNVISDDHDKNCVN